MTIEFLISPSVSITNGSKTLNVTGSVDTYHVYNGTQVVIGNSPVIAVVEGVSGSGQPDGSGNSTITLAKNWELPDVVAQPMVAMNTNEGLPEAIRRAREFGDNYKTILANQELLLTSTNPTVTIPVSGVDTEFVPYQYLSDKMGSITGIQDLSNPLCKLFTKSGLGDKITGSLSVINSSTKIIEDRYGVLRSIPINTLGETSDGFKIEDATTNFVLDSRDVSQWQSVGVNLTSNATLSPDVTTLSYGVTQDTLNSTHEVRLIDVDIVAGTTYVTSFDIKANGTNKIQIRDTIDAGNNCEFDLVNGVHESGNGGIVELNDGWYRCWCSSVATITTTGVRPRILLKDNTTGLLTYAGDGVSGIFIDNGQIEESSLSSRVETTGATVTRLADEVSFPCFGNAPRIDKPFSIVMPSISRLTAKIKSTLGIILNIPESTTSSFYLGLFIAKEAAGSVLFRIGNLDSTNDLRIPMESLNDKASIAYVFDGVNLSLYVDGFLLASTTRTAIAHTNPDSSIYIGKRSADASMNSTIDISDLMMFDFALNETTIKTLFRG